MLVKKISQAMVRTLPQCSIVVYSLMNSDPEELAQILTALNGSATSEDKKEF